MSEDPYAVYDGLQGDAASLRRLPYRQYLLTYHWQRKRRAVLERSGRHCKRCWSEDRPLEVHHLSYDRLGCETEADLIVLCSVCHAKEHGHATDGFDLDLELYAAGKRLTPAEEGRLIQAAMKAPGGEERFRRAMMRNQRSRTKRQR